MSNDNAIRKRAEENLMQERESNPVNLLNVLVEGMKTSE